MKKVINLITLIVVTVLLTFTTRTTSVQEVKYLEPVLPQDKYLPTLEDSIRYEIDKLDFRYPYIVLAQAKLESGNFDSDIFHQNNNMFGMKMPSQRPTTALGKNLSYAYFNTWICSIEDQKIYYTKYLDHRTEEEVFKYLSKYYAQDIEYVQKLKNIIQKEKLREKFSNDNLV
jgi:uncharacterized FlgJ-related protein